MALFETRNITYLFLGGGGGYYFLTDTRDVASDQFVKDSISKAQEGREVVKTLHCLLSKTKTSTWRLATKIINRRVLVSGLPIVTYILCYHSWEGWVSVLLAASFEGWKPSV